jgi:flavin prenyltransferase
MTRNRLIVGVTGATGIVYAARLLESLRGLSVETHLVVTKPAEMTAAYEWSRPARELRALADVTYSIGDIGAAIASGSFRTLGMSSRLARQGPWRKSPAERRPTCSRAPPTCV